MYLRTKYPHADALEQSRTDYIHPTRNLDKVNLADDSKFHLSAPVSMRNKHTQGSAGIVLIKVITILQGPAILI